jgi:hypothetical protein
MIISSVGKGRVTAWRSKSAFKGPSLALGYRISHAELPTDDLSSLQIILILIPNWSESRGGREMLLSLPSNLNYLVLQVFSESLNQL